MFSAVLSQRFDPGGGIDGEWSLGALYNTNEKDGLFLGPPGAFGGLGTEDDIFADTRLDERRLEARISLRKVDGAHSYYGELATANVKAIESEQFINLDPATNLPSATPNEFPAPVDPGTVRKSLSLVLQDEYRIDDMTTLTTGLRIDDYQRIGEHISPRIALVWRYSDEHVFKSQLARAFRPPSLIEEGGAIGMSIDPEINDTLEFGHIHERGDRVLRNTIYFTRLDDLIWFQDSPPFGYRNVGSQELFGYEVELEQALDANCDIHASLSLQDYADEGLTGEAPWMLKLGIGYALAPLTDLYVQLNAISERERADGDTRDDFDQSTQLDIALRRRNLAGVGGLDLRAGIRNLLDERLEYPAPAGTYPGDYPYSDGAELWLQLVYRP